MQNVGSEPEMQQRLQPMGEGLTGGLADRPQCRNISDAGEYARALGILTTIEAWIDGNVRK